MSMINCQRCDRPIDSDDDPDCFVEVSNPLTAHIPMGAVLCEVCREENELSVAESVKAARDHLACALSQVIEKDDKIIVEHIRAAHYLLGIKAAPSAPTKGE